MTEANTESEPSFALRVCPHADIINFRFPSPAKKVGHQPSESSYEHERTDLNQP